MLSTSIFYSGYNILFGVLSLFIGLASVFMIKTAKEFKGLFLFQFGGLCVVLITYLSSNEHVLYKIGLNFNLVAFVQMILALLTSVIWINAASELQNNQPANREVLTFYLSLCLIGGLYYSFYNYNQSEANMFNAALMLLGLFLFLITAVYRAFKNFNLGNFLLFCSIFMLFGK